MTLSSARNNNKGMTLVELLVAMTITVIILTAVTGIYFNLSKEWELHEGQETAITAVQFANERLKNYIQNANECVILSRYTTNDTLLIRLPADQVNGTYSPVWNSGTLSYRSGQYIVFYLSNSTGEYNKSGDILWGAVLVEYAPGSFYIYPDSAWSLYYNSADGIIDPISSIRYDKNEYGERPSIVITASSIYRRGNGTQTYSQPLTVALGGNL